MKIIASNLRVLRYTHRRKFEQFQVLERVWYIFGWPVWSWEIDREDVPMWASIELATLGSTEWRSKFAEHIN